MPGNYKEHTWSHLLKGWITLSTENITIQWIDNSIILFHPYTG